MSPAQSEDSGLAADRGTYTTYATISIPRKDAQDFFAGIVFADRTDLSYPAVIESINVLEPNADFLAPGDKIHQIDGISTIGITNQQIMNILLCHNRDENALIEIEYCLPEYLSQNSLCVTTKMSAVTVERENGCLGLTLRSFRGDLIVTNVRPNGPVWKTGRIKPGDRVLRVDNISLLHKTLPEAQQILKNGHNSGCVNLTIEYEVSVMQTVEFSLGPLLIEIERSMNEQLGLVLSNYMTLSQSDYGRLDDIQTPGIYIASILPASIADRCGALSVGDQILSVDETVIENTSFTPDEVKAFLDSNCTKGFTQIQILPATAQLRRKGLHCTSPKYGGFNTVDPRKTPRLNHHTNKKLYRKSSLPLDHSVLCRSETIQLVLDCTHGSGLCLAPASAHGFLVTKIMNDSPAERCGCIQKGDRVLSVNKIYNLDIHGVRQLLGDVPNLQQSQQAGTHWVELEVEFDLADSVIPTSGVFNVKLIKSNRGGLGITVNGSPHGAFIITDVKPGSPAHRTGSLRSGDILLAVDSHPIQHFNVDVLLKDNKNECITLTVKRNSLPDYLFDAQSRQNSATYANYDMATNTFSGFGNKYGFGRSSESPYKPKMNSDQEDYGDGIDPYYQTTRYWSTLKSTANQMDNNNEQDQMISSMNNIDIVNYSNIDFSQKMMSLSLCPQTMQHQPVLHHGPPNAIPVPPPLPPPMPFCNNQNMTSSFLGPNNNNEPKVFTVQLVNPGGGPLGLSLSNKNSPNNEDNQKPIVISGLEEGGIAQQTGKICLGDVLLAVNNEPVTGIQLMDAKKLLQTNNDVIELQLSRPVHNPMTNSTISMNDKLPQPQAIYAKVQRRPCSPTLNAGPIDMISNSSSSRSGSGSDSHCKTIHVTLYKDQVYDDYGFSVSDGLYEKGVYINRIRSNGPADVVGVLKPYDRIIQVNGTKTQDFDCCLTVPIIAAAGDKIDLVVQRGIID